MERPRVDVSKKLQTAMVAVSAAVLIVAFLLEYL